MKSNETKIVFGNNEMKSNIWNNETKSNIWNNKTKSNIWNNKRKIIFGIMEKLKNIKKTRYFNFHICVKEVNLPLTLEIFFHDY